MKRNVYKSKRAHSIIKERKHTEKTSECREILPGDPAFSDHDLCTLELKKKSPHSSNWHMYYSSFLSLTISKEQFILT